mgnify:CR=1 FL=1
MSQQHESIEPVELSSGPTRRTILKAAAWSAPVVAIATAAPLASASPTSSDINVTVGSNISGTGTPDGTASGNLAGALNITSIGGSPSWETGALTAVYSLDASNGAAWGGDAAIVDGSSAQFHFDAPPVNMLIVDDVEAPRSKNGWEDRYRGHADGKYEHLKA